MVYERLSAARIAAQGKRASEGKSQRYTQGWIAMRSETARPSVTQMEGGKRPFTRKVMMCYAPFFASDEWAEVQQQWWEERHAVTSQTVFTTASACYLVPDDWGPDERAAFLSNQPAGVVVIGAGVQSPTWLSVVLGD